MSTDWIAGHFERSLKTLEAATRDADLHKTMHAIANAIIGALQGGNKVMFAGNGGSAADAQHLAAEIMGRYKLDRPAWAAVALTTDTSALTAVANDYGFEQIFARQVQGLGRRGDVFIGMTTSGTSPNIVAALKIARELGLVTVGMTGLKGKEMGKLCDHLLVSPTDETPVVQQIHLAAGHAICDAVEHALIDNPPR